MIKTAVIYTKENNTYFAYITALDLYIDCRKGLKKLEEEVIEELTDIYPEELVDSVTALKNYMSRLDNIGYDDIIKIDIIKVEDNKIVTVNC